MRIHSSFDVERMALYNLERAQHTLDNLQHKDVWAPEDTASFDCMHYLGDSAIAHCANTLELQPHEVVLDIGSGFNATGRYLNRHHGVTVRGVELQESIHAMGEAITARNGQSAHVHSINANFLTAPQAVIASNSVDHVVSFLCILHIPDRAALFDRVAKTLKPGGRVYIEDFYARHPLSPDDASALRDIVSCPYLPSRDTYVAQLANAGLTAIAFEDVSPAWQTFVGERAAAYHTRCDRDTSLDTFYSTVARLFASGRVGGARLSASLS